MSDHAPNANASAYHGHHAGAVLLLITSSFKIGWLSAWLWSSHNAVEGTASKPNVAELGKLFMAFSPNARVAARTPKRGFPRQGLNCCFALACQPFHPLQTLPDNSDKSAGSKWHFGLLSHKDS